ncbi:hypothetical protein [Paenibacillus yonginensis]|uniref:hypothetical protein n=1 Tax=Paenibacillus yonginensis TaxID=1462996 RepID=UPI001243F357|nr:hypothetical protein [Paenibacillus yonginensis]
MERHLHEWLRLQKGSINRLQIELFLPYEDALTTVNCLAKKLRNSSSIKGLGQWAALSLPLRTDMPANRES